MTTLGAALGETALALAAAGFDEPRRHARRVLSVALDIPPTDILAHPERPLAIEENGRLSTMLRRVLDREPLSRIAGRRAFWGLEFGLSPDTLDPRPDSETVVEAVLHRLADRNRAYRILDLGTGTGCLLLALLSELPRAEGFGIDVAPGAAIVARRNARELGMASRARFVVADWTTALNGTFDVIVANPPYIAHDALQALPREVAGFDPRRALDGGGDGLAAYRSIAAGIAPLLRQDGLAAVEIGQGQSADVCAIFEQARLGIENVAADLAGIARCVVARLEGPATSPAPIRENCWNTTPSRLRCDG